MEIKIIIPEEVVDSVCEILARRIIKKIDEFDADLEDRWTTTPKGEEALGVDQSDPFATPLPPIPVLWANYGHPRSKAPFGATINVPIP